MTVDQLSVEVGAAELLGKLAQRRRPDRCFLPAFRTEAAAASPNSPNDSPQFRQAVGGATSAEAAWNIHRTVPQQRSWRAAGLPATLGGRVSWSNDQCPGRAVRTRAARGQTHPHAGPIHGGSPTTGLTHDKIGRRRFDRRHSRLSPLLTGLSGIQNALRCFA
jgi:hypothetical protein